MRSSRGEIKIQEILTEAGLVFDQEHSFPGLVSVNGTPLRFDFCVYDDDGEIDFLIQFQGIQHFEAKSIFGGLSGLRKQQKYDMEKRKYCEQNHIRLLIIPYWDLPRVNYDYIMTAVGY